MARRLWRRLLRHTRWQRARRNSRASAGPCRFIVWPECHPSRRNWPRLARTRWRARERRRCSPGRVLMNVGLRGRADVLHGSQSDLLVFLAPTCTLSSPVVPPPLGQWSCRSAPGFELARRPSSDHRAAMLWSKLQYLAGATCWKCNCPLWANIGQRGGSPPHL